MGIGDCVVVVDKTNERVSLLNLRAIRRTCELRGTRIGDEEERNWARRRGGKKSEELVMANGWGAQG